MNPFSTQDCLQMQAYQNSQELEFFSLSHVELIRIPGSHTNLTLIAPLLHNTPIDLFKSTGTELDKCSKFLRCMWRLKGQWGSKQVVREQRRMELLSEQKILCLCKKLCVIIPKKANVTVTAIVRSPPICKVSKEHCVFMTFRLESDGAYNSLQYFKH